MEAVFSNARWIGGERTDGGIVLDIDVPPAVPAMLGLPDRAPKSLRAGHQQISL